MICRSPRSKVKYQFERFEDIDQDFFIIRPAASIDFCGLQTQHAVIIVPSTYTSAEENLLRRPEMVSHIAKTICYSC